ncbi:uncharacterized protein LOC113311491 [Papaver somniferum]|uniref:uncharacterized protein LOC113311491 n=1 Tax=Papaver somniferum TaxID=3469 RepID=UPI000E6F9264|nr:uncharacterized protein LOC113311491 [Papaver somniferum]
MCKYFAASLAGEALKWFEGLPIESVSSFHHLQNIFLGQYVSNNPSRPGIETAFRLRRRTNESLRHPTTRWRTMFSEMGRRVDERHLILAFINALFATDLLYTQIFRIKDTITMSELREFQEEYIALEEKQRDMESYPVAISDSKGGNTSLLPRLTNDIVSTSQGNHGRNSAQMEQKLVAMGSADQAEFDKEYKDKQLQNLGGTDAFQPGSFAGQQTHYNKKTGRMPRNLPPQPPQGNTYAKEKDRNTFVIEVGAKEKNLYYEIPGGGESHECPLVVRLGINLKPLEEDEEKNKKNTWAINMILIDTGSSVDILFYHTYKTMGGRDDELIPSIYKIYGLDIESPYNALIGRPWMHGILAVASTFHQCIKFPLPQGVGIIRGDTVESKNCQEIDVDKCEV